MYRRRNLLLIIIMQLLCHAFVQLAAIAHNGWVLTQRSKIFGDQYLYLTSTGVKCVSPKQNVGWVTQAPNWNITFFNERTKLYFPLSYKNWKTKMAQHGLVPSNIHWTKVGKGTVAGLAASHYTMTNAHTASPNQKTKWLSANYWLADTINVPANLSQLISSVCGLPPSNSVPLQLSYTNEKGQTEVLLSTYHQQSADIPDQYFYLPAHYKLAKSEVDVLMNQENRALLDELADDLSTDNRVNQLPDKLTLPNGKSVSKDEINRVIHKFR